ncbi:MAG: hypothetical protein B7X02_00935, partial [Rhodospirillales bacterium 12-54-5]
YAAAWEKPLEARAESVDKFMNGVAKRTSETVQPLRSGVSKGITAFSNGPVGRGITNATAGLVAWRHDRVAAKLAPTLTKAQEAFTTAPRTWAQFFTFRKPGTIAMPSAFHGAMQTVRSAEHLTGHARAELLAKVPEMLAHAAGEDKALLTHAGMIEGRIAKAANVATKAGHFGEVMSGGVETWVRNAAKGAGNAKLVTGIIAVGVLAGAGISFFGARKGNSEASQALKDFKADIGNEHSALVKAASTKNTHQAIGRHAGAVLNTASEAMMLQGNGIGDVAAILPAQMALGSVGNMLGGQNPTLVAHAALKKAERGELAMNDNEKVEAMAQLVASVPEVEANGGIYSPLTTPVAQAILDKLLR